MQLFVGALVILLTVFGGFMLGGGDLAVVW